MTHYTMFADDSKTLSLNLEFGFRFPIYRTIDSALSRFHELQKIVESTSKEEANRDFIFKCLNECDFILNTLEGYDQ